MSKKLWIALIVFLIVVIAAAVMFTDPNKIIVGVDNNPPYTFLDQPVAVVVGGSSPETAQGKYTGFDVDVLEAAAKKAGLTIEYRDVSFGKMMEQIKRSKKVKQYLSKSSYTPNYGIDAAIGGISVTEERASEVDFTIPYATGGACIVTKANSAIQKPADLSGKVVGVELATTMVPQAAAVKGARLHGYQSQPEMYIDLYDGAIDAIVMDRMSAAYAINKRGMKDLKIVPMPSREDFAIAVNKSEDRITKRLNKALTEMQQNGELASIYEKWFGK